ncbi:MAG: hypothetical protein ACREJD_05525 [Phycisphaerales bacterium]
MKSMLICSLLLVANGAYAQMQALRMPVERLPAVGLGEVMQLGRVRSAGIPIPFAKVTMYIAGGQKAAGEQVIGTTHADANGDFAIAFTPRGNRGLVYYVIAEGPLPRIRLATVIGTEPFRGPITINERTTIATAYAMAQFIHGTSIGGKGPGLQSASATLRNLVDVRLGGVGFVLGTAPNGTANSSMATFNSLANALAGAVRGLDAPALFLAATPPGGPVPTNTLDAAINIAHNSWRHAQALFDVSTFVEPYTPALEEAPVTWTIALKYIGNGHEFDGPGAPAFDAQGNAWINNNYDFREDHSAPTCGGRLVSKLTPTGEDFPGAPYDGTPAGVDGAGFGICLDPQGRVWLGNFGFFGNSCPCEFAPPANSASLLSQSGVPLSPPSGFTQGCITAPQGTVSDQVGNIWFANTCGGSVARYANGNPDTNWVFDLSTNALTTPGDCPVTTAIKPFGVAIDAAGNGWVSLNRDDAAVLISLSGQLLAQSASGSKIKAPMGIAVDSVGDVWVANSGIVDVPCVTCSDGDDLSYGPLLPDLTKASVTKLSSTGAFLGNFAGGGIYIPWGICVDGDDNVWVANFGGQRVSAFRGDTGEAIAPQGFHSDALIRNTAVTIDPSGNVWLANNWLTEPPQTNPGGDGMVVFIGIAAPVKTPMLGPVRKP